MEDRPNPAEPRRTVGGGATLATGAAFLTAIAGGLLNILVARLLGPADTGIYNIATATLLVCFTLGTLGINVGVSYFVSNGRWAPEDAFAQLQVAALGAGLAAAGLGAALALATRHSLFEGVAMGDVLIVLAAVPFVLSWMFASSLALALDRYETYAVAPLASNGMALVLSCVATPLFGVTGAVTALLLAHVLCAVGLWVWGVRTLARPRAGWLGRTPEALRRALRFGTQSYAPQVLQLVNYRADLFILNAVAASAVVGRYAVALAVTELGVLLPRSLSAVVLPRVSALDGRGSEDQQRMVIEKSVRHTLVLTPGIGVVLAVAVLAIPLVFGSGFQGAVEPGLILIPGVLALGVANVMVSVVVGKGHPRYALYVAAAVTPPTLLLYLLIVPSFEANGAALASTASYAITAALTAVTFFRAVPGTGPRAVLPSREDLSDYGELFRRGRSYLRERTPRAGG